MGKSRSLAAAVKLESPLLNKLGGLLASSAVRWWMGTLDYKAAYYDRAIDPVFPECRGQKIYIFWHEYILFPLFCGDTAILPCC